MMNVEERLDDLEISVDATNEVVIEKLADFQRQFNELVRENKASFISLRNEINAQRMSPGFPRGIGRPLLCSSLNEPIDVDPSGEENPCGLGLGSGLDPGNKSIPVVLDDVESETKDLIRNYMPSCLDAKERLTPAQYAYVMYWVSDRKPETSRKGTAARLREDGIRAKMWTHSWKPAGTASFENYLVEKIKLAIKKQKKIAMKRRIETGEVNADN